MIQHYPEYTLRSSLITRASAPRRCQLGLIIECSRRSLSPPPPSLRPRLLEQSSAAASSVALAAGHRGPAGCLSTCTLVPRVSGIPPGSACLFRRPADLRRPGRGCRRGGRRGRGCRTCPPAERAADRRGPRPADHEVAAWPGAALASGRRPAPTDRVRSATEEEALIGRPGQSHSHRGL